MLLDIRRILTKHNLFVLAQILAVISGTWMMGSGIFMGLYSNLFLTANSIITQINQEDSQSYLDIQSKLLDNVIHLSDLSIIIIGLAKNLFLIGAAAGALSLLVWLAGSMMEEKT